MDTGSRRTHKTVPRRADKQPPAADLEPLLQVDGVDCNIIRATGDVLLDVTFENSKSKVSLAPSGLVTRSAATKDGKPSQNKNATTRMLFRVRLETLRKTSKYFQLLLEPNGNFEEGKRIATAHAGLEKKGTNATEADVADLPRISIMDDDDATRYAGRDSVFGDLLRILHGADITTRLTVPYMAALAVMADRFDCHVTVGHYLRAQKRPWPQTYGERTPATEELLRQKILISWLMEDHIHFNLATKELILRGSLKWTEMEPDSKHQASWWDLPDGIEAELHIRRSCILATIASVPAHFLAIYTSRIQQCKQFYDSSAACDSYQLGEMMKFFISKGLISIISALSSNYDELPEVYDGNLEVLITILRQCPSYQIDKFHAHCGLRARILPALDHLQSMITSDIGIQGPGWKKTRPEISWEQDVQEGEGSHFRFTRGVQGDQRIKMPGLMGGSTQAKILFCSKSWDWTPSEDEPAANGQAFGNIKLIPGRHAI